MLVKCPECGNQVSGSTNRCLKCGYEELRTWWGAGKVYVRKQDAFGWSKTLAEAEERRRREAETIKQLSRGYKTPKEEAREEMGAYKPTPVSDFIAKVIKFALFALVFYLLFFL